MIQTRIRRRKIEDKVIVEGFDNLQTNSRQIQSSWNFDTGVGVQIASGKIGTIIIEDRNLAEPRVPLHSEQLPG